MTLSGIQTRITMPQHRIMYLAVFITQCTMLESETGMSKFKH